MTRQHSPPSQKKYPGSSQEWQRKKKAALLSAIAAGAAAVHWGGRHYDKTCRNDSKMTGQAFMDEHLGGHPEVFYDNFGMHKHVFRRLLKELQDKAGLSDTKHVSAVEQLGIFLYAIITGLSIRKLENRFQRSKETITVCVWSRLTSFLCSQSSHHNPSM
jgi:hypothetical protein